MNSTARRDCFQRLGLPAGLVSIYLLSLIRRAKLRSESSHNAQMVTWCHSHLAHLLQCNVLYNVIRHCIYRPGNIATSLNRTSATLIMAQNCLQVLYQLRLACNIHHNLQTYLQWQMWSHIAVREADHDLMSTICPSSPSLEGVRTPSVYPGPPYSTMSWLVKRLTA